MVLSVEKSSAPLAFGAFNNIHGCDCNPINCSPSFAGSGKSGFTGVLEDPTVCIITFPKKKTPFFTLLGSLQRHPDATWYTGWCHSGWAWMILSHIIPLGWREDIVGDNHIQYRSHDGFFPLANFISIFLIEHSAFCWSGGLSPQQYLHSSSHITEAPLLWPPRYPLRWWYQGWTRNAALQSLQSNEPLFFPKNSIWSVLWLNPIFVFHGSWIQVCLRQKQLWPSWLGGTWGVHGWSGSIPLTMDQDG